MTAAAIVGMLALAAIDLVLNHETLLAVSVVSALAGWMSHKTSVGPPPP